MLYWEKILVFWGNQHFNCDRQSFHRQIWIQLTYSHFHVLYIFFYQEIHFFRCQSRPHFVLSQWNKILNKRKMCINQIQSQCLANLILNVLDTKLCDKVCQRRWFSTSSLVSSTSKADCHYITEILLKVALNTINQTKPNLNSEENFSHSGGQHIFSVYIFEVRIIAKKISIFFRIWGV